MIDPQLDGKVAVVTGANHGIGAASWRSGGSGSAAKVTQRDQHCSIVGC